MYLLSEAVMGAFGPILFVILLLGIAGVIYLIFFHKKFKNKSTLEQSNENNAIVSENIVEPTKETKTEDIKPVETKKEDIKPVEKKPVVKKTVEPKVEEGLSLKESMAKAAVIEVPDFIINKQSVANWIEETYGDKAIVNRNANYTVTGLPLADCHYAVKESGKVCFIYVYELIGGNTFFLLKLDEKTAEEIQQKHENLTKSRFPKSKYEQWYTMLIDDTFKNSQEVLDVIALAYARISKTKEIHIVSSVTVSQATNFISDEEAEDIVNQESNDDASHYSEVGKKTAINVDTLAQNFNDGDIVSVETLIEKKLVDSTTKQIKILARGTLDKKLIIYANDYSLVAAKMIIATGGKLIIVKTKK